MMKYPRTYHLPNSPGVSKNDKIMKSMSGLLGKSLYTTIKMDGSSIRFTRDNILSRGGGADHESFDLLKQKHASIKHNIPDNLILYGEWLYALHSIAYSDLSDYLMIFAIFDFVNKMWIGLPETLLLTRGLGLTFVPIMNLYLYYDNEDMLYRYIENSGRDIVAQGHEGFVIRPAMSFPQEDFSTVVGKYVRASHVTTDKHWKKTLVQNKLKTK